MSKFIVDRFDDRVVKCNKTKARRLYGEGRSVYVVACNSRVGILIHSSSMKLDPKTTSSDAHFDSRINHFEYYNCCSERGRYAHFYYID